MFGFILDILFPKLCVGCGKLGSYICIECQRKLEYRESDSCFYCDKVSVGGITCSKCDRKELDGVMSVLYYNTTAKRIIKNIKYRLISDSFRELFRTLDPYVLSRLQYIKKSYPNAVLQPIPLHRHREQLRGFNQARIIAEFFSFLTGLPVVDELKRIKDTAPQAQTKSRLERFANIQRAFAVKKGADITGKTVILVDDVVTTGSTAKEAAKTLRRFGAKDVLLFTLAKGLD